LLFNEKEWHRHKIKTEGEFEMPCKSFLENKPLYYKFYIKGIVRTADKLPKASINMFCENCNSNQTFQMTNNYNDGFKKFNPFIGNQVIQLEYTCVGCEKYKRYFSLYFAEDFSYMMKVGQYPAWDISIDRDLEKMLEKHVDNYKKGLICESQGYGIGAYSYYRRIVEDIIDKLLDTIPFLMTDKEKNLYEKALEETKKTTVAQEKIVLVKDLLPQSLRPNNFNPLSILHSSLSEGLHSKTDEECLELAESIREVLVFLVTQVVRLSESSLQFTESMKKILDKRNEKRE
jgi:hypothetical protein